MSLIDEAAFLESIQADPEDDGPRMIFADWLDEQGDPRGELIRLQCALARLSPEDGRRPDLEAREREVYEANESAWTEPLRGLVDGWEFRRGFIESVSIEAKRFLHDGESLFRTVPVRRIRFLNAAEVFPQLVESPLLAEIRELDFCGNDLGNGGPNLLARSSHLQNLEGLNLGYNDLTDRGLETLTGISALTRLRSLSINDNPHLGPPGIRALADSPYLGQLRTLDISGNGLTSSALRLLINSPTLKLLDHVALHGNAFGDAGIEALAESDLLKRMLMRSPILRLSRNNMGPVSARALANSPLMELVELLDLDSNGLGDTGLEILAESPHLRNLKTLLLRENRITDVGLRAVSRSQLPASLTVLDLWGNLVTAAALHALSMAAKAFDWRKQIDIRIDTDLHTRAIRRATATE